MPKTQLKDPTPHGNRLLDARPDRVDYRDLSCVHAKKRSGGSELNSEYVRLPRNLGTLVGIERI